MRFIESIGSVGFIELKTEENEAKGSLTPASLEPQSSQREPYFIVQNWRDRNSAQAAHPASS